MQAETAGREGSGVILPMKSKGLAMGGERDRQLSGVDVQSNT